MPSQRAGLLLAEGDVPAAAQCDDGGWSQPGRRARITRSEAGSIWCWPGCCSPKTTPARRSRCLQRLLGAAASQGRAGSVIEIQALRALALAARGDHASALGALTEALTLARGPGYVRVFADEGAPMRALLAQLSAARPGQQARGSPAASPATRPRSCAPAARQTPRRRRGDPRPHRRAWPSR